MAILGYEWSDDEDWWIEKKLCLTHTAYYFKMKKTIKEWLLEGPKKREKQTLDLIEKLESLSNPFMDLFMDFETLKNNIKKSRKL